MNTIIIAFIAETPTRTISPEAAQCKQKQQKRRSKGCHCQYVIVKVLLTPEQRSLLTGNQVTERCCGLCFGKKPETQWQRQVLWSFDGKERRKGRNEWKCLSFYSKVSQSIWLWASLHKADYMKMPIIWPTCVIVPRGPKTGVKKQASPSWSIIMIQWTLLAVCDLILFHVCKLIKWNKVWGSTLNCQHPATNSPKSPSNSRQARSSTTISRMATTGSVHRFFCVCVPVLVRPRAAVTLDKPKNCSTDWQIPTTWRVTTDI